ncbi:MAG: hypothetical protein JW850_02900 [Thermoflexales bacterium]|nr:hypothetical protein [Thermoflexales bacterium]
MRRIIQLFVRPFAIVERVLRNRIAYFAELGHGEGLPGKIADLLSVTTLGLAIFGFVAGLSGNDVVPLRNGVQAFVSAIKLPFLFLASGLICLPTLYYFSVLFGSRLRFLQTVALILTAQAVAAVLAVGFAPISLLFRLSGSEPLFLVALNVGVLGLAAGLGLIFLVQGVLYIQETQPPQSITFFTWIWLFIKGAFRSLVLAGWIAIYGLVGAQLSWTLRPFFGVPLGGHGFWSSMANVMAGLLR